MPELIIPIVFVLIVTVGWFITTYNRFIKYRNNIEEAWSRIDVALKRRFNLIPNLVRAIEGYGKHEAKLFHPGSGNPAGIARGGIFQISRFQKVNPTRDVLGASSRLENAISII
ncbi:MAG: LemA family protein [Desulfobacterales bacterium]